MGLWNAMAEGEAPGRGVPAMTTGVVTSLDDPDGLGRVEVRLPHWGEEGANLGFLRVLTPMAGAEWGVYLLPEVGDEVLVGFCEGGIHSACVLGSLWNGAHKQPAAVEDGKNDTRLIKSRSGHCVTLCDKDGEARLELVSGGGLHVLLDDEEERITLSDKDGKNLLCLDAKKGEITVAADKKVLLKAGKGSVTVADDVAVDSGGALTLQGRDVKAEAKAGVSVAGKSTVEVKSSGQLNLEASGPAALKGATLKLN